MSERVHITIDGKQISAPAGANLLNVARENGIDIPGLCYHKKLTPTGACRLCITKINGTQGFVTSCTTTVKEGMEVTAFDEELEETRRSLLEYMLVDYDAGSDGTYEDEFKEVIERYGLENKANRKLAPMPHQSSSWIDDSGVFLTYDAGSCIRCQRCIKACSEIQGKNVLSMTGRGMTSHVIAGFGRWSDSECDYCGECVQLCPTGALVEKPNRDKIRLDDLDKKVHTTCGHCGLGCQVEMLVKDNTIMRINGVPDKLPNDGRLCVKGRFNYDFVSSDRRVTRPLIKTNGTFHEATWEEAIDLVASKLNALRGRYGHWATGGLASAKCTNEENYLFQKFVRTRLGNNNVDYSTMRYPETNLIPMMLNLGEAAATNALDVIEKTDCILLMGSDLVETLPVMATFTKRSKANGAKIIVIDSQERRLNREADLYLKPRKGTKIALINGILHVIFHRSLFNIEFIRRNIDGGMQSMMALRNSVERFTPEYTEEVTGVERGKIIEAATIYASAQDALVATGMDITLDGQSRSAIYALMNLCLVTGKIGRELSGIQPLRFQNNEQGASDAGSLPYYFPDYRDVDKEENRKAIAKLWNVSRDSLNISPGLRTVEMLQAAEKGAIKGLYILGQDPVKMAANPAEVIAALKQCEFVVVQDIFFNETAPFADVVLPAVCFAEKEGTFTSSNRMVLRVRKAVDPPGEARADWQIIAAIAERMVELNNQAESAFQLTPWPNYPDASAIFEELTKASPNMAGLTWKRLDEGGIQWPCTEPGHPGTKTLFLERFNTADGLARLHPVI